MSYSLSIEFIFERGGVGGGGDKLNIYVCYDMRYKECTLDVVVFTVCSLFVYSVIYITPMFDYINNKYFIVIRE